MVTLLCYLERINNTKMQFPLVYRVKTPDGWRWFAPIIRDGSVYVVDRGQECHYPVASSICATGRRWTPVEPVDYDRERVTAQGMKVMAIHALRELKKRLQTSNPGKGRQTLRTAADAYLIDLRKNSHHDGTSGRVHVQGMDGVVTVDYSR